METVYPLSPEERLLSTILNTGVTLHSDDQTNLKRTIAALLKTLPSQQSKVLRLRFGIGNRPGQTLQAIGRQLDLTRERIRQIEEEALMKLRDRHRIDILKEALDLSRVQVGSTILRRRSKAVWGPPNR